MSVLQVRNPELVELLRPDFQHRNEPNFAWKSIISSYLTLPGLIAFWPMSVLRRDSVVDQIRDVTGAGYHLQSSAGPLPFGYENLIPYVDFVAANTTSASRADGGAANWSDVTGLETYFPAALRGLTYGAWIYPTVTTAFSAVSKWDPINHQSYELRVTGGGNWGSYVSSTGLNNANAQSTDITANEWHLVIGRFDPGATVDVFVNGTWTTQATAFASIFDSNSNFMIGKRSNSTNYMDGRLSMVFLAAAYISDAIIGALWEQTRVMFGN